MHVLELYVADDIPDRVANRFLCINRRSGIDETEIVDSGALGLAHVGNLDENVISRGFSPEEGARRTKLKTLPGRLSCTGQ